jgi:predicted SnoaL-like aldol condensation-catalyzing enzyme
MNQKEIATTFLKMAGMGQVDEAYARFIAPAFIHHNPYFAGDRASLLAAMKEDHAANPNRLVEVKHIYEDGNTVITHSHVAKKEMEIAVVHIFRFQGDKVVELWDVGQVVVPNSANANGPF